MTEPKRIEDALKECQEKFLNLFRGSPLWLTLSRAKDYRYVDVNDTFERVTGWTRDEVINRTPFDIGLYVDPSERVALVKRVLAGEIVRNLEIHLRIKNGEIRIGSGSASLIEIDGERLVLILVADLTDLKRAEEAEQAADRLSRMGQRLMKANEEERKAIARELHDYVDSLVLLSLELDGWRQNPSKRMGQLGHEIDSAKQQVEGLVKNIQTLSERLHAARLEYLGLERAAARYCAEISDTKGIGIDFTSEGVPPELPSEISLSLFRVLQDALQNAVEHSGSQRLQVLLKADRNQLSLTVRDSGVGFDPEKALNGPGVGLTIMKERLKLVDGELSIHSQPQHGTTVYAQVPLRLSGNSAWAVN